MPHMVQGKRVVEVGSYDVNGSVRPIVESYGPASYIGVDIRNGPGVDMIADVTVDPLPRADLVISCEMLEHVEDWQEALWKMMHICNGYMLLTTRSPGWPYHGYPADYWRFTIEDLLEAFKSFNVIRVGYEDTVKHGGVCILAKRPTKWRDDWSRLKALTAHTV